MGIAGLASCEKTATAGLRTRLDGCWVDKIVDNETPTDEMATDGTEFRIRLPAGPLEGAASHRYCGANGSTLSSSLRESEG